jgi:DNA-binding transcriptional LysR family regulator
MAETHHGAFDLDWNLIRSFVAVARTGSLAAGARQLGIAHPTVARHLQQLEEAVGFSLFARTARGLVMNEAGEQLFAAAAPMQVAALGLRNTVDTMGERPIDRVRITVAEITAELLPALTPRRPSTLVERGVALDVIVTDNRLNLLDREADIAIRHARPTQQELICRRVGTIRMRAYASEDYIGSVGRLQRDNVASHRLIDSFTNGEFLNVARAQGFAFRDDQVVFRSDSLACQKSAAKTGWGIGAFPQALIAESDGLVDAFAQGSPVDIPVWLVARPEVRDNKALKEVYDRIAEALGERLAASLSADAGTRAVSLRPEAP